jgi:hypothetical protein
VLRLLRSRFCAKDFDGIEGWRLGGAKASEHVGLLDCECKRFTSGPCARHQDTITLSCYALLCLAEHPKKIWLLGKLVSRSNTQFQARRRVTGSHENP